MQESTTIQIHPEIEKLRTLAKRAYNGVSFSPEERGQRLVQDLSRCLYSDLEEIKEAPEQVRTVYAERYSKYAAHWLNAMSRIVSPMISGPSNFPTARMEKYRNWERSASESFTSFRTKATAGIKRDIRKASEPPKEASITPNEHYPFEAGEVVVNWQIERIQIVFNDRPDQEMITKLKGNGFKWAPSQKAWQRFNTNASRHAVNFVLQTKILN